MISKTINLGNNYLCLTWKSELKRELYFKYFDSVDAMSKWMSENKDKYHGGSAKIKRSGLFSLKKGWKLVRYPNGDVVCSHC